MNPTLWLIQALRSRDFPAAHHYLSVGADINGWTEFDNPILHEFVDNGNIAVVDFLLTHGKSYNLDVYQLNKDGEAAFDIAMRKQYQPIVDLFNEYFRRNS